MKWYLYRSKIRHFIAYCILLVLILPLLFFMSKAIFVGQINLIVTLFYLFLMLAAGWLLRVVSFLLRNRKMRYIVVDKRSITIPSCDKEPDRIIPYLNILHVSIMPAVPNKFAQWEEGIKITLPSGEPSPVPSSIEMYWAQDIGVDIDHFMAVQYGKSVYIFRSLMRNKQEFYELFGELEMKIK